ncbi:MAG: UvrD-helicase domain-containing protein, partial [Terrimicrobiaceae bacterium]
MKPDFDFAGEALEPGLSVIEASAGTGKTYAISHLVPRLLLDDSAANLGEILLVTFTNDAARELADRVRRVIEKLHAPPAPDEAVADAGLHRLREKFGAEKVHEVAGRALLDLDLLGVSTIHSFCQKVLQTEGTLCGLPAVPELIPDSAEIADRVLRDLWESLIAGNALHAAVASAMRWKLDEDLSFLKTALPLENPEPVPEAGGFESGMAEIENLRKELTKDVCDELGGILASVTDWTQDDPGETVRSRLAAGLGGSTDAASQGFLDAVRHAASAPEWVSGSRKEGKALKAKAAGCRAVEIAAKIVEILDKARWNFRIGCLAEIRPAVARALAAARQITYDGLIDTLRNAVRGGQAAQLSARLRSRFKVALIDESQDTDDRQFEIFRNIFVGRHGEKPLSAHRLVLIGDPKQAIYAFRGADVNTYLAAKYLAGGRVYSLTKTFRSPAALVRATNALFFRSGSLLKDGLDFLPATSGIVGDRQLLVGAEPDKARVECWIVPDADGDNYSNNKMRNDLIAGTVASEIVRLLNGKAQMTTGTSNPRDVRPGDFAILVSDGRQAEAVADALLARDVPAVRAGSDDIMASEEAGELLAILRALHEPRRIGLRLAALATRMLGVSSEAIHALTASGRDEEWMGKFLLWQEAWLRQGIASAIAVMDSAAGITIRLTSLERGERSVTNLRQLTDLLETAS